MESPGRSTWNGHQDSRWHLLCVCSRQPVGRCCTRESLELYCNNNMRRLPPSTLHMFLSVSSTTAVVVVDCTFAFSYVNFLGRGGGSKTTFSNFRNVACRQHEPTLHPILFSFFLFLLSLHFGMNSFTQFLGRQMAMSGQTNKKNPLEGQLRARSRGDEFIKEEEVEKKRHWGACFIRFFFFFNLTISSGAEAIPTITRAFDDGGVWKKSRDAHTQYTDRQTDGCSVIYATEFV